MTHIRMSQLNFLTFCTTLLSRIVCNRRDSAHPWKLVKCDPKSQPDIYVHPVMRYVWYGIAQNSVCSINF